jgi:subtilisin family serine protease
VSCGARNPNGSTALFSNAGKWVATVEVGAGVVSTFPKFDGSESPDTEVRMPDGTVRETIDPDDFASGFGVWSGTSFAGPVLAGKIAATLYAGDLLDTDATVAVDRCWTAVETCVPELHR